MIDTTSQPDDILDSILEDDRVDTITRLSMEMSPDET